MADEISQASTSVASQIISSNTKAMANTLITVYKSSLYFVVVIGIMIVISYLKQLSRGFVVLQWIWVNVKTGKITLITNRRYVTYDSGVGAWVNIYMHTYIVCFTGRIRGRYEYTQIGIWFC